MEDNGACHVMGEGVIGGGIADRAGSSPSAPLAIWRKCKLEVPKCVEKGGGTWDRNENHF